MVVGSEEPKNEELSILVFLPLPSQESSSTTHYKILLVYLAEKKKKRVNYRMCAPSFDHI